MIYLDYPSHTPADPAVLDEFCRVEREYMANPRSNHKKGQAALAELERATAKTAELLNANPMELTYTSGATMSNDMAIKGLTHAQRHVGKHIITTVLEHPSVSGPLAYLKERGFEVEMADILPNGKIDLQHLEELLRPDTILLTVSWVDSELGAIQPMADIIRLLKSYPNCRLHVDAAQAVGKIPVSFEGIDTLSFSPHKFHGICGIGGLLSKMTFPHFYQGTPALGLVAAASVALELAVTNQKERIKKVQALRRQVIQALDTKVIINSPLEGSPFILNLSVPGIKGTEFQSALDEQNVYVSVKSACAAAGTPSRAVLAVSRDKKNAISSWRIGFSHITEDVEIEGFIAVFKRLGIMQKV